MHTYRGTRWYKCDLHLHTPASKCFKDKTVTPEMWVNRALEQKLDCVAVTDHNTAGWVDKIKEAAEGTNLIVFPGVEITCSDAKVHLLVLFDESSNQIKIEDFLVSIGIDRNTFSLETAHTNKGIMEVAEAAEEKGALVIPAHIDEFNSIASTSYEIRKSFLNLEYINSVQVVHNEFVVNGFSKEQITEKLNAYYNMNVEDNLSRSWKNCVKQAIELNKTLLTFSDNPNGEGESQHGLWGIGNRYTWIKMSEQITLESLRQALLLPKFRVRNDFDSQKEPHMKPNLWIESIKISNCEITNAIRPLHIEFSPQMTTIIGGRGTGKSSILKFLRGVFDRTADISSLDAILEEHNDFFHLKNEKDKKGILNELTVIEVMFHRNNIKYKITAQNFKKNKLFESTIQEWNSHLQTFEIVDLEGFIDFFEFDIFSQKQIYDIAQAPNALRIRIDNSISNMSELRAELEIAKSEYLQQVSKIRSIKIKMNSKSKLETDLADTLRQISSFEESGYEELYNKIKSYQTDARLIESVNLDIATKIKDIEEFSGKLKQPNIEYQLLSIEHRTELEGYIKAVLNKYEQISNKFNELKNDFTALKIDFEDNIQKSNWKTGSQKTTDVYSIKKSELDTQGVGDLNNIEQLTTKSLSLKQEIDKLTILELQLLEEYKTEVEIKQRLLSIRKSITTFRKQFIADTLNSENVRIQIKPFRDKEEYKLQFRKVIQRENGFEEDIDKLGELVFNGDVLKQRDFMLKQLCSIRENTEQGFYGGRFRNLVVSLSETQCDELEILYPEDEIEVSYKSNKASVYKPLSNASAGQKTSAILTFILSYGEIPLILDQPEDDLDNHLIYELIVSRLRKCKENRQIIVVTHNANIPVNGDTELVLALNSELRTIELLHSGAIEEPHIRKEICDVMEGGETAFELRSKRYKLKQ